MDGCVYMDVWMLCRCVCINQPRNPELFPTMFVGGADFVYVAVGSARWAFVLKQPSMPSARGRFVGHLMWL